MIKEAYCSFEVAKLLKERGFNEPCREHYHINGEMSLVDTQYRNWNKYNYISAPTHQMALSWLRERHCISINIRGHGIDVGRERTSKFAYDLEVMYMRGFEVIWTEEDFDNYEDPVEKGIKIALYNT